jgi:hypothetical protein
VIKQSSKDALDGGINYDVVVLDARDKSERLVVSSVRVCEPTRPSADGSQIALLIGTEEGSEYLYMMALDGGADRQVDVPPSNRNVPGGGYTLAWRPGTEELWAFDIMQRLTIVLRPGEPLVKIERTAALNVAAQASVPTGGVIEPGTPPAADGAFVDGNHWLSMGSEGMLHLNDADDPSSPEGPAFPLTDGAVFQVVNVAPDSYVAHLAVSLDRFDLYWIAPSRHETRLLAARVGDVVYGTDRVLVLSKMAGEVQSVDLTLYDLATGSPTLVAQNVTGFALAPCDGCGPIDSGTPIVYAIHALYPYSYDGIWTGTLP